MRRTGSLLARAPAAGGRRRRRAPISVPSSAMRSAPTCSLIATAGLRRRNFFTSSRLCARDANPRDGSSSSSTSRYETGQRGILKLHAPSFQGEVEISPSWIEHFEIRISGGREDASSPQSALVKVEEMMKISVETAEHSHEADGKLWSVVSLSERASSSSSLASEESSQAQTLHLLIPHTFDVHATVGEGGRVSIKDKIEGNVDILCQSQGKIEINKARGERMQLRGGDLEISGYLEGEEIELQAQSALSAKKLTAKTLRMKLQSPAAMGRVASASIGAIYAEDAELNNLLDDAEIKIGSAHGRLRVTSERRSRLSIDGVNGSLEAEIAEGDLRVHVDKLQSGSRSKLSTGSGDISLSFAPEVTAALSLASSEPLRLSIPESAMSDMSSAAPTDEERLHHLTAVMSGKAER